MKIWNKGRMTPKAIRVMELLARGKSPFWIAGLLDVSLKHVMYVGFDVGLFGKKRKKKSQKKEVVACEETVV